VRYEWVLALVVIACVATSFWVSRFNIDVRERGRLDLYCGYAPNMKCFTERVQAGELPLWNPYQVFGKPFLAYPMGYFYAPAWLFFVLPMPMALQILAVLHLVAAGFFTYWFCRTLKLTFVSSLAGGFSFLFCGFMLQSASWSPIHAGATVWVPLGFVCVARLFRDETYGWAVGLTLTCAVQILAGFPQFSLYMYYGLVWYALVLALSKYRERKDWRLSARLLGLCVGALMLGALAASIQLVPTGELAGESLRLAAGSSYRAHYETGSVGRFVGKILTSPWRAALLWELAWPSVVASLGGVFHRRRREAIFFGGLAAVSVLLGAGRGSYVYDLFSRLPTGNIFSFSSRFSLLYSFAVAVLAGMGLDLLATEGRGAGDRRRWGQAIQVGKVALYAAVLALCVHLIPGTEFKRHVLGTVVCAVIAAAVCVRLLTRWRLPWRVLSTGCAVLFAWQVTTWFNWTIVSQKLDETVYEESESAFEYLKICQGLSRAIIVTEKPFVSGFAHKLGAVRGVYIFGDYDALENRRVSRYISYLNAGKVAPLRMIQRPQPVPGKSALKLLNLVGVKHVVVATSEDRSLSSAWEKLAADGAGSEALALKPVFEDAGATIYENRNAIPRAYFVPDVQLVTNEEEMLRTLASPEFDARRYALIEDRLLLESHSESGAETHTAEQQGFVRVEQYGSHEVRLHVEAPTAGFVVLTDLFYPGWRAEVDGTDAEIHRANYLFRMVRVGKGEHEVRFVYSGGTFYKGLVLSVCAVMIMVVYVVVARAVSRKKGSEWLTAR